jgi:RimJ/RimL family protein N-acetyltransferase
MDPFHGQRVVLRPLDASDAAAVAVYVNDPSLYGNRQIDRDPQGPLPPSRIEKLVAEANSEHSLGLAVEVLGRVTGHITAAWWWDAMTPEIGVVISPGEQRKGYGTEATTLVLDHLFATTVAEAVHAWVPDFSSSGAAFAKTLGFQPAGRMRRTGLRDGAWFDTLAFDLLRAEWRDRDGA